MTNNKLTIGNSVYNNSLGFFKIECGEDIDSSETFNPIELTEKNVKQCGFEKLHDKYYILKVGRFELIYYYSYSLDAWKLELEGKRLNIEHLHELENIIKFLI